MRMKWILPAVASVVFGAAIAASHQDAQATADYVAKAVADPARGSDTDDDARRKVGDLVKFSEAKPGDRVLELIPGGGYFTKVFSKVVGTDGKVYAIWPIAYDKVSEPDSANLRALSKEPGFGNIEVLVQPAGRMTTPHPVDVVFTSQNYHDYPDPFMGPTDPALLNQAVFAALKPGGTYIVVDHVAEAGSGLRDTDTLHRIDPATVKQQVLAAGFEYVGESDVLRNAKDDHKVKVFDKSIRGHTDQFAYKFRKPSAK